MVNAVMNSINSKHSGYVLLEALIAVAIFSFALLGLVGLQAVSVKNSADAKYRADATYFANQIINQMWVDRANLASYAYRNTDTTCSDSSATSSYVPVTNWITDMANVLPGVASGSSSQKPIIAIDTTEITSVRVSVTICWKAPNDASSHNHIATAQINL